MREAIAAQLAAGIDALGLSATADQQQCLLDYLDMLVKWNRVYNLTAICKPARMVTHHLLDSLAVLPHVHGARLLDVGSGAGLPGVVLAAVRPDLHCTLLDSNGKKTRFLTQAAIALKLANVEVVHTRVEEYRPAMLFDSIVSRAFSDLSAFMTVAAPLLAPGGRLLAMKGARAAEELRTAAAGWRVTLHVLAVPGLDAARELVVAERAD